MAQPIIIEKRKPGLQFIFKLGLLGCMAMVPVCFISLMIGFIVNDGRIYFFPESEVLIEEVDMGDANRLLAEFDLSSGDIEVIDNTTLAMMGRFEYSIEPDLPDISYEVDNDNIGRLQVRQQDETSLVIGDRANDWSISLNNMVPVDLDIHSSSGNVKLDLVDASLTRLELDTSSGDIIARLGGTFGQLETMNLDSSSGEIDIRMNGDFLHVSDIRLNGGSGDTTLEMLGTFGTPIRLDIRVSSGDVTLNLRGTWRANARIDVETSSGDIQVRLPSTVNIDLRVDDDDDLRIDGLSQRDSTHYILDLEDAPTLELDLERSSGGISVEVDG